MVRLTPDQVIDVSADGTFWFPEQMGYGRYTLQLTFPTGVTGTFKGILTTNKDDSRYTGPLNICGVQVEFASGGTYATAHYDLSGGKWVGIEMASLAGGSAVAELHRAHP